MRSIKAEQIDFSRAMPVTSAALKFVIPVAAFSDGDPILYPDGTELAGQPIRNWDGSPLGERGIVFFNAVDRRFQGAASDGRSVIIVNEVTREQAEAVEQFVRRHGEKLESLPKPFLRRLLEYLVVELGLVDVYNSTDDFVRSRLVPIGPVGEMGALRPCGWMRRDDRDICLAVFVKGPVELVLRTAGPQQIPAPGAFIVRQGDDDRMVEAGVFLRTYLNLDGTSIDLAALPALK